MAGLSASYHLGQENCQIFEQYTFAGGHIHSERREGFTWDEGPHVSFTKHAYVRDLFAASTEFLEYPVFPTNYYKGSWVPHPAQTNLHAVPLAIREQCLRDFRAAHGSEVPASEQAPENYREWLEMTFGQSFATLFPRAYTEKYWTTDPQNLTTDWVGVRVHAPNREEVEQGALAPLDKSTHYISSVRYPKEGGYISFANKIAAGARITYGKKLSYISFAQKKICFADGSETEYEKLVSTIPLPVLILQSDAPPAVKEAAKQLSCSSVLIVNAVANHPSQRSENWIYVYDEDKLSTRINLTELLSPANGVPGKTGVQVEVYFSKYRELSVSADEAIAQVCAELVEMGLIKSKDDIDSVHSKWIEWANVIFDQPRRTAMTTVFDWLQQVGLAHEADELEPATDWDAKFLNPTLAQSDASIYLAGRFGQWKYYWTDDCVMRGKYLGERIK